MNEYLTREEVAKLFRVSPKTLRRWKIPRIRLPGSRLVRYRKEDVDAFVRSRLEYDAEPQVRERQKRHVERGIPKILTRKELMQL